MRKNPNAVALGRRTSPAKAATARQNGRLGGRPSVYRLTRDGGLERQQNGRWLRLEPPYDRAARAYLSRHR